jgi:LPS-assembly lipoprotein
MWCSDRRKLLAALVCLPLAACGFEPLYAPAGPGAAVAGRIEVDVIESTAGFALRERLVDRLGLPESPTHRLAVSLNLRQVGVAITQDDVTSRYDVIGNATWRLFPHGQSLPVLTGETSATTGYSAPSSSTTSTFAVLSAKRDAEERLALTLADRIAQRLAVDAPDWAQ